MLWFWWAQVDKHGVVMSREAMGEASSGRGYVGWLVMAVGFWCKSECLVDQFEKVKGR